MANVFTWGGGVSPYTPSFVGGTSGATTTKIFPSLAGPGFNLGGANLGNNPPTLQAAATGTPAAICTIPGTGQYEQQQIELWAAGYIFVHGTTPTVNFLVQQGTSLTNTSNTTVATLASAQSLTTNATYPWAISLKMQADAVSGIMQFFSGVITCNGVAGTVTLTDLTGVNLTTTNLSFVIGITFAVSDALNKAALSQFQLKS